MSGLVYSIAICIAAIFMVIPGIFVIVLLLVASVFLGKKKTTKLIRQIKRKIRSKL